MGFFKGGERYDVVSGSIGGDPAQLVQGLPQEQGMNGYEDNVGLHKELARGPLGPMT